MKRLWVWSFIGFLLLVAAGSVLFSRSLYAAILFVGALFVLVLGMKADYRPNAGLNLLVVVVTFGSAIIHIARPDFVVEVGLLGQIVEAELTTWNGLAYLARYTVLHVGLLILLLLIVARASKRDRSLWWAIAPWLGFAGAVHLPCEFAIAQPALNISIYDPQAQVGRVEAFALGYLLHPTIVYLLAQLVSLFMNRGRTPGVKD